MRRRTIIGSLLLIAVGVSLGGTVLQDQVANARAFAQAVTVDNTPANAVPVREQNRDANGNIKVHEQGTANMNVTNSALAVRQAGTPVTIFLQSLDYYTVPAGKHLVLTYVTGQATSSSMGITNLLNGGGFFPQYKFPATNAAPGVFYMSEPVTIFADGGDRLQATGGVDPSLWASGYVTDS